MAIGKPALGQVNHRARTGCTTVRHWAVVAAVLLAGGSQLRAVISSNGMTSNSLAVNGLPPNSPAQNVSPAYYPSFAPVPLGPEGLNFNTLLTNRTALAIVRQLRLGPDLLGHSYIRQQLADPDARGVLRYLYACACAQGQWFTDTEDAQNVGTATTYVGELGLAPGWCGTGQKPEVTLRQRELVSACIAGRVSPHGSVTPILPLVTNPVGVHNAIGARSGPDEAAFVLRDTAFYGDVFAGPADWVKDVEVLKDGTVTGKRQEVPDGTTSAFPSLFACVAAGWADQTEYADARACAGGMCLGTIVGSCAASCTADRSDQGSSYQSCDDPWGKSWSAPVTMFVRDRCAFSPDPETCAKWRLVKTP